MSDSKLQELRRQASTGDLEAQNALDIATCRIEGHTWDLCHFRSDSAWAKVEICARCLATQGTRIRDLMAPKILSVYSNKYRTKSRKITHAVHPMNIHFNVMGRPRHYSLLTACKTVINDLPSPRELIADCSNEVTCKNCLRVLAQADNSESLAKISTNVYSKLYKWCNRPPAIKKRTVVNGESI